MDKIKPNKDEVTNWLVSTLKHVCNIEYFLDKLDLGSKDPQRPHDIVGIGNKYSWAVIRGFALQYREPKAKFEDSMKYSLNLHRKQYHHQKWNEPHPDYPDSPALGATREDMLVGAVDAVCSLLENRKYQGGAYTYDRILREVLPKSLPHKTPWMMEAVSQMMELPQPNLEQIVSLKSFPNIGLKWGIYEAISRKTQEALKSLKQKQGYSFE